MLKINYKKLESDISVSKTVSSLLTDQIKNVERQCWAKAQYSRRECIEVFRIPSSFNIKNLEGKVCTVFNRIGVAVKSDGIEYCYRLGKRNQFWENVLGKEINTHVLYLKWEYSIQD